MIAQAIRDIYCGTDKEMVEVAHWVGTEDYYTCCWAAFIEPDLLEEEIEALFLLKPSLRKKYAIKLNADIMRGAFNQDRDEGIDMPAQDVLV